MPDGSKLEPGATFSSIRTSYEKDDMWQAAKKYHEGQGEDNNGDGTVDIKDYEFQYHRFWHAGDAIVAYGTMALLYPEVKPLDDEGSSTATTTTTTTTTAKVTTTTTTAKATTTTAKVTTTTKKDEPKTTTTAGDIKVTLWGDANVDGDVDMSDVVLIMQSLASPNKYGLGGSEKSAITAQGQANGDVDTSSKGITSGDALRIQEYLLKKITSLDPTK